MNKYIDNCGYVAIPYNLCFAIARNNKIREKRFNQKRINHDKK